MTNYSCSPLSLIGESSFNVRVESLVIPRPFKFPVNVRGLEGVVATAQFAKCLEQHGIFIPPPGGRYSWIHLQYQRTTHKKQLSKINNKLPLYVGNVAVTKTLHPGTLNISICSRGTLVAARLLVSPPNIEEIETTVLQLKSNTLKCKVRGKYLAFYHDGYCFVIASCKDSKL